MRNAEGRVFHTLDALRGIAALSIVLFHGSFLYGLAPPAEGQVAVDLFFVMSGFIIAYRYDARFAAGLGVAAFLRRRLARLYPLFLLGSLLGAVAAVVALASGHANASHRHLLEALPLAAAMLPSTTALSENGYLYPLNAPAWTLALELLVNAAYAATFPFWTVRRLAIGACFGLAGLAFTALWYGTLDVGFLWSNAPGGLARVFFGFAAGVLIFRVREARMAAVTMPWWCCLVLASFVFLLPPPISRGWWECALVAFGMPALVVAAVASDPPRWAHRACTVAGSASYVVYSLHFALIGLFMRAETLLQLDLQRATIAKAAAFTALLTVCGLAAHHGYDRPVRRWLAGFKAAPRSPLRPAATEF